MKNSLLLFWPLFLVFLTATTQADERKVQDKPDIGFVGLFSLSAFNRSDPTVFGSSQDPTINGFNFQEFELNFSAPIDHAISAEGSAVYSENTVIIEEATMRSMKLPFGLEFKGGEFLTAFGLDNPTHQHLLEFVNRPLIAGRFFGGKGLRNPGAQISWQAENSLKAIFSGQDSIGESAVSFLGPKGVPMRGPSHYLYLLRLQDSLPISTAVLDLGGSIITGPNESTVGSETLGGRTTIFGGDFRLHFLEKSPFAHFSFQGEYMRRNYISPAGTLTDDGVYVESVYQLSRWTAGLRIDYVSGKNPPVNVSNKFTDDDLESRIRFSPALSYYPSEYSKFRLQYDYDSPKNLLHTQQAITFQYAFSVGGHGAQLAHVAVVD